MSASITWCRNNGGRLRSPLLREYWPYRPDWLDYVKINWTGIGRVQQDKTDGLADFREKAFKAFLEHGYSIKQVKSYLSIQVPKSGCGYDEQYPHTHEPADGVTLIHYLQPGDIPAPLDIFDGDEVVETIYPETGLTVFVPNDVKHGVRINEGTTDRIQLIATGLRR